MNDRDCKSCIFSSYLHGGCCSWDCEYINRREAAEAWREKYRNPKAKEGQTEDDPN